MSDRTRGRRDELPPEVLDIVKSSLRLGALTGLSGVFFGGISGVLHSSTPKLFAVASGFQWFTLGTSFWAARSAVLYTKGVENRKPRDLLSASAIAGSTAGAVGGLLRGPRNIIPGAIVFGCLGTGVQFLYNVADGRRSTNNAQDGPSKQGWMDSKWSPVKLLTDEDYEKMLQDKLLRVNAEIALVEENIERLQEEILKPPSQQSRSIDAQEAGK